MKLYKAAPVIIVLAALLCAGPAACSPKESVAPPTLSPTLSATTPPPDITNPAELIAAVKQAAAGVKSFRAETVSSYILDRGGSRVVMDVSTLALVDLEGLKLYIDQVYLSTSAENTTQQRTETYWTGGWVYRANIPVFAVTTSATSSWYKYPQEPGALAESSYSNTGLLTTMEQATIVILGSERAQGVDCYKLSVSGDLSRMFAPLDPKDVTDVKVTVWVSKADFRLVMTDVDYRAIQIGSAVETQYSTNYSNYNQVKVELPASALGAVEVPPPATAPPPTAQSAVELKRIIAEVKLSVADLKSFSIELLANETEAGKSTGKTATGKIDLEHQRYYLDEKGTKSGSSVRTESYYWPEVTYERQDVGTLSIQPGAWYKNPPLVHTPPLFATHQQRIAELLDSAEVTLGGGNANGIECFTLNIKSGFSRYLPQDLTNVENFRFVVYVAKENYHIMLITVTYSMMTNGVNTQYLSHLNFSHINSTTIELPPEALSAPPPPSPPPPATPPTP